MADFKLTTEQQAVVDNRGGTLLVSAAAGSGKTMVLIDRVLALMKEKECDLDRFLMITFTQAAAAELRGKLIERMSKELALQPDNRYLQRQMSRAYLAQISTVHSFCASVLRDYAHLIDLPADFSVCDEIEAKKLRDRAMNSVLDAAYEDLDGSSDVAAALDMLGAGRRNDDKLPEQILKLFNALQSYSDPGARMQKLRGDLDCSSVTEIDETVWGAYLLEQFRIFLDRALKMLETARSLAVGVMDRDVPAIDNTIEIAKALREKEKWNEICEYSCSFSGFSKAQCADKELKKRVMKMRNDVRDEIKKWKEERIVLPSDEALRDLAVGAGALRGLIELTERFAKEFSEKKRRAHVLDYNDLEHEMLRLARIPSAAREISERYEQIMVDEYQDTNEVQDTIFRLISRNGENLFFVGDVKQSVYGFRRADPTIFLEKYKSFADYTEAKDGQPRKILLSDNFRSHPAVLEAANDVFRLTMTENVGGLRYGDAEALRPNRDAVDMHAAPVELYCIEKERTNDEQPVSIPQVESEFVAGRIAEMLRSGEQIPEGDGLRPVSADDIVILLRSMKSSGENFSETYKAALAKRGIRCVSDNDNIFETDEITVLTALLQVIDNPHQDIPLLTVLMSPLFGCSANDLALARANHKGDIYEILRGTEICGVLEELRSAAQTTSLRRLLDLADDRLFIRTLYGAMEDGAQRVQNIDRFFALADSYESGDRYGLSGFVRYLEPLREKGITSDGVQTTGAVRITTVHKSKGLEYPVVFLSGLGRKFNSNYTKETVLINGTLGLGSDIYDADQSIKYPTTAKTAIKERIRRENMSEEMRVLYVGMTRAKYRLVMTCCMEYLNTKLVNISSKLTIPAPDLLLESVGSMGEWILMTAMTHLEAGALFEVGGTPAVDRHTPEYPWKIRYYRSSELAAEEEDASQAPRDVRHIEYRPLRYAHEKAVAAPSKVTATQLKGRALDEEISENTEKAPLKLPVRKPQFSYDKRSLTGAERGTAIHLAMQYIRYERCTDIGSIQHELDRMVDMCFLTERQREAVPEEKILNFFRSSIGKRVLAAEQVIREYKFSVLEDGSVLDPALAGEKILLQGVTDCCLIENGGITILDFKSDQIKPGQEAERAAYYRGQLDAYARALSRVLGMPVRERLLYFFSTDAAINA